ncbi:18613_t:CDS:2 [Funneliformis geosporum]|uniref:18613_t:CDS:1 n=1 Tax=Funneliformis geosporum TaxID=1117311 RepID=A0A9W4WWA4_9GLOM|nr:18613_t:CDS:2 [Funneliformis geosporum]
MSPKRKLHQLIGTIENAYQGISKRKELFYFLNIEQETILATKRETIYAFYNLTKVALRKLDQLNKAKSLFDLTSPPRNCLETLRGA